MKLRLDVVRYIRNQVSLWALILWLIQTRWRERRLSPAITVLLWSIFPFHWLLCFHHQNSWGVCRSAEGVRCYCMPKYFSPNMWNIAYGGVSIAELWLIQRDLLCSAAAFYNTSSLKKSRTAHRVLCVHGSVCVCVSTCVYLLSAVCVHLKKELYNEQWASRRHGSFLLDDQNWEKLW